MRPCLEAIYHSRSLKSLPLPHRCVITGDLNAHHVLWNSAVQTPQRADELVALIEEQDWHLVSTPDAATHYFRGHEGSSVLALTLASLAMTDEVANWAVDDEQATGSDHKVIRFQAQSMHPDLETTTPQPHLNWQKTNWDEFATLL
jgi:hypothetical protein